MEGRKFTEADSSYRHLEKMSVKEILKNINEEDKGVPFAIEKELDAIEALVNAAADKILAGGRLFYIGAGTSGRLAVVDASECMPTFGVPEGLVIALIAGGEAAFTNAVEGAEDKEEEGWNDLQKHKVSEKDFVVGISASGTAPYVVGALKKCREKNISTGCITNNKNSLLAQHADFPIEVVVGPEFITGSTRMKSGTAQKLVLNMISTSVMIQLGRVEDNKMVHMQLTNEKLLDRGIKMVMEKLSIKDYDKAKALLLKHGSVKKATELDNESM